MNKKAALLIPFFVLTIALFLIPVISVSAQQPTPSDDEVNAIARQLYCPVCENTPLDVCPTKACHQWRELIRQMLAEGKSAAEIKQYFVDYYGARVLSEPPVTGINWLVYIVPPVAFLIGVFLLFLAFRTWKKSTPTSGSVNVTPPSKNAEPGSGSEPDDQYIAQLEEELKKRN